MHILENIKVDLPEEKTPCVCRVGWSVDGSDYQLGEDKLSWGYGGTGKSAYDSKFLDYGKKYGVGDVITCCADLNSTPKAIFYMVNGEYLGVAFRFTNELNGRGIYPHVTSKNMKYRVNFGEEMPKFPITNGFKMLANLSQDEVVSPPPGPSRPEDAEVIMMVGLPASGKSFWCEKYAEQNKDKKYHILGTNIIIDRMKVSNLTRRRNYHGRWEELIKRASSVLKTLFEVAKKRPKNYILDQTNVYFSARRKKMEAFRGYKRIAAVLVNKPEVLDMRTEKQQKAEGKIVPEEAVMEMKRNFTLPDVGPSFDEVWFLEELKPAARNLVESYRSTGEAFKKAAIKRPLQSQEPRVEKQDVDNKRPRRDMPPNRGFQPSGDSYQASLHANAPGSRSDRYDERRREPFPDRSSVVRKDERRDERRDDRRKDGRDDRRYNNYEHDRDRDARDSRGIHRDTKERDMRDRDVRDRDVRDRDTRDVRGRGTREMDQSQRNERRAPPPRNDRKNERFADPFNDARSPHRAADHQPFRDRSANRDSPRQSNRIEREVYPRNLQHSDQYERYQSEDNRDLSKENRRASEIRNRDYPLRHSELSDDRREEPFKDRARQSPEQFRSLERQRDPHYYESAPLNQRDRTSNADRYYDGQMPRPDITRNEIDHPYLDAPFESGRDLDRGFGLPRFSDSQRKQEGIREPSFLNNKGNERHPENNPLPWRESQVDRDYVTKERYNPASEDQQFLERRNENEYREQRGRDYYDSQEFRPDNIERQNERPSQYFDRIAPPRPAVPTDRRYEDPSRPSEIRGERDFDRPGFGIDPRYNESKPAYETPKLRENVYDSPRLPTSQQPFAQRMPDRYQRPEDPVKQEHFETGNQQIHRSYPDERHGYGGRSDELHDKYQPPQYREPYQPHQTERRMDYQEPVRNQAQFDERPQRDYDRGAKNPYRDQPRYEPDARRNESRQYGASDTSMNVNASSSGYLYTSNTNQTYGRPDDKMSTSYQTQMTTSTANYSRDNYSSFDQPGYRKENPQSYNQPSEQQRRQSGPLLLGLPQGDPPARPVGNSQSYEKQQEDYQKAYSQWYANYAQAFAQLTQQNPN